MLTRNYSLGFELLGKLRFSCCMSRIFKSNLEFLGLVTVKISVLVLLSIERFFAQVQLNIPQKSKLIVKRINIYQLVRN
jgi:hypothetical protein